MVKLQDEQYLEKTTNHINIFKIIIIADQFSFSMVGSFLEVLLIL